VDARHVVFACDRLGGSGYERKESKVRGAGRVAFAGFLLLLAGTLNVIYGIGAIGDANVFTNDTRYIFSDLNTYGWILIILGVIQLTAAFSLFGGGTYGRVIGIAAAMLGAVMALVGVGGVNPWWSLGIFALCVYVMHGLIVYGEDEPGRTA